MGEEKVRFTGLRGYGLNYPNNFGVAVAWFLAEPPKWVCFDSCKSKKAGKFKSLVVEYIFPQTFVFGPQTLMTPHF